MEGVSVFRRNRKFKFLKRNSACQLNVFLFANYTWILSQEISCSRIQETFSKDSNKLK